MDFNGPGLSLFQGNDLANFDNNAQREEEEEAIEDQRRRNIELKDILETAFDDVSFENEDCSGLNMSFNEVNSNCHNKLTSPNENAINKSHFSPSNMGKSYSNEAAEQFNTPVRHSRSVRTKTIDFNNHFEPDNYSDQFKVKQNGSLHDIVDASGGGGGGGDGMSVHYNHCARANSLGDDSHSKNPVSPNSDGNMSSLNKLYQSTDFNSIEQLQVLYDVRVREVHRLTELIDKMKNSHEMEKSDLKRQFAFALAENERHKISYSEMQSLLVSSKEEIDHLKHEIESLKREINELEESKEGLIIELDTSKMTINNLERKVLALEKGRKDMTAAMQYEANIQELKEKQSNDMRNVLKELDSCKMNLVEKSKENEELKYKLVQISQLNDENLAKKSEIIHRLSKQIEETQEQCEKLMRSSLSEDNVKLQMEIKILKDENSLLTSKIVNLEKNLATQDMELKQYECLSNFSVFDSKNDSEGANDKESEYSEINRKLREELFRALNSQKSRRQEMQSLQALIHKKDEQIHSMTEKERVFLAEAAKFRDEMGEHVAELKKYENLTSLRENENKKLQELLESTKKEFEKSLDDANKKYCELEKEKESLEEELVLLKNNEEKGRLEAVSKYNEEYMKFHNDGLKKLRENLEESYKLEILGKEIEIENLKKEVEDVKNLYVEVYNEKENLLNQIEKDKVTNRNGVDVDEVRKLQKELEKSRERILDLDLTLRQQYQQEVEKLNGTIKSLSLELEKVKRERDHKISEKEKTETENELLKGEVEQLTAEKNLHFLNCETLTKEIDQLQRNLSVARKNFDNQVNTSEDERNRELSDVRAKYEIKIQKLNKEIELMLTKAVSTESKYTSPMKSCGRKYKNAATQGSPISVQSASTSPLHRWSTQESCTSPIRELRTPSYKGSKRDMSVLTDPEPKNLTKREVIRMMEKLGADHEEEMNLLESNYKLELVKLDKRWQSEIDSIREEVRLEMLNIHAEEIEGLQEKHRIEMENRIEQEKKEAVVALITEWACEVQNLKQSHAEAQAETEKMRAKYKTAKNLALRYKAYFTSKAEHMKEEWKKVEQGYEKALKELEKNVHMLVDVREDEVKAKVESITKVYEQKIDKMKRKLEKYELLLKSEVKADERKTSSRNSTDEKKSRDSLSDRGPEKLVPPSSYLCRKTRRNQITESKLETSLANVRLPPKTSRDAQKVSRNRSLLDKAHFFDRSFTDEEENGC